MKRNQNRDSRGFLSWIKGVWGSFSRFVMRLLRPNRGRRSSQSISTQGDRLSPLMGVEQFHNAEALTVGNLMANVQWRVPKPASSNPSVGSVRDQIKWD
jgi:hypothetical protein